MTTRPVQRSNAGASPVASSTTEAAKTANASTPAPSATPSSSSRAHGRCSAVTARKGSTRPESKGAATARRTVSAVAAPTCRPTSRCVPETRKNGIAVTDAIRHHGTPTLYSEGRLDALADAVRELHAEGFSLGAIGVAIGLSEQAVSDLGQHQTDT